MKCCRVVSVLCVVVLLWAGCFRGEKGPRLVDVAGTVMVDGNPLEEGVIIFDPADGKGGSYGGEIRSGGFVVKSEVGEKSVTVRAYRITNQKDELGNFLQEQYLPAKYNHRTELRVDVSGEQESPVLLQLKSRG